MTLDLMSNLFREQISFAIETTLSGKIHQRIIAHAQQNGYYAVLIYVWVKSPRVSISRLKSRMRLGGHFVPLEDVIRRYKRGLINLFRTYMDICDYWAIIDNSKPPLKLVAERIGAGNFKSFIKVFGLR